MPRIIASRIVKQHISDTHKYGEDYIETARLLGVKRTMAWGIVRRRQLLNQGGTNRPHGGARTQNMDQEMTDNMVATVEYTHGQTNARIIVELPKNAYLYSVE